MCEVSCQEMSPSKIKSAVWLGIGGKKTTQDMYKKCTRDVQENFKWINDNLNGFVMLSDVQFYIFQENYTKRVRDQEIHTQNYITSN